MQPWIEALFSPEVEKSFNRVNKIKQQEKAQRKARKTRKQVKRKKRMIAVKATCLAANKAIKKTINGK
jgi:hypothetical protein